MVVHLRTAGQAALLAASVEAPLRTQSLRTLHANHRHQSNDALYDWIMHGPPPTPPAKTQSEEPNSPSSLRASPASVRTPFRPDGSSSLNASTSLPLLPRRQRNPSGWYAAPAPAPEPAPAPISVTLPPSVSPSRPFAPPSLAATQRADAFSPEAHTRAASRVSRAAVASSIGLDTS